MKLEKMLNYLNEATTADLILTVLVITITAIVIASIIYIGIYLKKLYKLIKQELSITNRHLSHLDHNNYTSEYEKV